MQQGVYGGKSGKTTDSMLDKISELRTRNDNLVTELVILEDRRDLCIARMVIWENTDLTLAEVFKDLRRILLTDTP